MTDGKSSSNSIICLKCTEKNPFVQRRGTNSEEDDKASKEPMQRRKTLVGQDRDNPSILNRVSLGYCHNHEQNMSTS